MLPTSQSELESLKMARGLKRKRSAAPDSQGNPFDSEEQTPSCSSQQPPSPQSAPLTALLQSVQARLSLDLFPSTSNMSNTSTRSSASASASTQHTASAAPPRVFKEIYSILPLSSGGKKKRSQLRRAMSAIKERVETVDLASHGFMSKMLDIILSIFEKCVINQMRSLC
ncbi:uncharacterized protein ABDE67_013829 [Symphorus nematophorus]